MTEETLRNSRDKSDEENARLLEKTDFAVKDANGDITKTLDGVFRVAENVSSNCCSVTVYLPNHTAVRRANMTSKVRC